MIRFAVNSCVVLTCLMMQASQPAQKTAEQLVQVRLVSETKSIGPGESFDLAIAFRLEKGWHTYWKNPGEGAAPPEVRLHLPKGFSHDEIRWPRPVLFKTELGHVFGYDEEAVLFVKIHTPDALDDGEATVRVEADYVVCDDRVCMFGRARPSLTMSTSSQRRPRDDRGTQFFEQHRKRLPISTTDAPAVNANFDGRTLKMTGRSGNFDALEFFPLASPGISYDKPEAEFTNGLFTMTVAVDVNPNNFLDSSPRVGGVVGLGSKRSDPSYECEIPLPR